MTTTEDPCAAFLRVWSGEGEPSHALAEALAAFLAEAERGAPDAEVPRASFLAYVADRIPADDDPVTTLAEMRAADLRVACACVAGDDTAMAIFVARLSEVVNISLRKLRLTEMSDDIRQSLFDRLLLPREDRPPALALYSGRGPLQAYVRVAVTREAFRLTKKRKKERPDYEAIVERAVADGDPETAALNARYGPVVKAAFQAAIEELESRERRLLRYHYIEQLTTRQMGVLLGMHSSTVTRQLAQTRAHLLQRARAHMIQAMSATPEELASIVRMVESQLDLSLVRMLATRDVDPASR